MNNRIKKQIAISYDCGHGSISLKYDMPTLTPGERRNVLEKLLCKISSTNSEHILDTLPTLDIVKALSKRYGVACNSVVTDNIAVATICIACQEDQEELMEFCSKRFIELSAAG